MSTVVGLFRRRRDVVHAWFLLRQHGFRMRELRIVPYDRFVQERLHPTLSNARTLHEYVCTSGGAMIGGLTGMLAGVLAFAVADPSAVFMAVAAGAGIGGLSGGLMGRYDPLNLVFVRPYEVETTIQRGAVLIRVAAVGERAARASSAMHQAAAMKVFGA